MLHGPGDGVVLGLGLVVIAIRGGGNFRGVGVLDLVGELGSARYILPVARGRVDGRSHGCGLLGGQAENLLVELGAGEFRLGGRLIALGHGVVELVAGLEALGRRPHAAGVVVVGEDRGERRGAGEVDGLVGIRGRVVGCDGRGIGDVLLLAVRLVRRGRFLPQLLGGHDEPELIGHVGLGRDVKPRLAVGGLLKDPFDGRGLVGHLGGVELGVERDVDAQHRGKLALGQLEGELVLPHHGLGDLLVGGVALGIGLVHVEDLGTVDVAQGVRVEIGRHALGKRDLKGVAGEQRIVVGVAVAAVGGGGVEGRLDAQGNGQRRGENDLGGVGRGSSELDDVFVALVGKNGRYVVLDLGGELRSGLIVEGQAVG